MTEKSRRRTAKGFVEATFHIPENVMKALKIKAAKEKRKYSDVADELLRRGLELQKEEPAVKKERGVKP